MNLSLSDYIKRLQALEAEGHGQLPVCFCDEDGWTAMSDTEQNPRVMFGDYSDESSTAHSWKRDRFVVA